MLQEKTRGLKHNNTDRMSLGTLSEIYQFLQAGRDGVARGKPGVPGVRAEVLGVKVVAVEGKGSRRGRKKKAGDVEAEQLALKLA